MNKAAYTITTSLSSVLQFENKEDPDCPELRENYGGIGMKYIARGKEAVEKYVTAFVDEEFQPTMERHLGAET